MKSNCVNGLCGLNSSAGFCADVCFCSHATLLHNSPATPQHSTAEQSSAQLQRLLLVDRSARYPHKSTAAQVTSAEVCTLNKGFLVLCCACCAVRLLLFCGPICAVSVTKTVLIWTCELSETLYFFKAVAQDIRQSKQVYCTPHLQRSRCTSNGPDQLCTLEHHASRVNQAGHIFSWPMYNQKSPICSKRDPFTSFQQTCIPLLWQS